MTVDLRFGKVESLNDPDSKGRIQVRLLPDLKDAPATALPWVPAFSTRFSGQTASDYNPPDKDSPVWCLFLDKYLQQGFYLGGIQIENDFDFNSVANALANIPNLNSQDQTATKFTQFSDGTITFQNPTTKEFGVLHSSGSFMVFMADGSINAYSVGGINIKNSQGVEIDLSNSGSLSISAPQGVSIVGQNVKFGTASATTDFLVTYNSLQQILTELITQNSAMIMIDPLTGTTGTVLPALGIAALFPTISSLQIPSLKAGS
jgi:hypothetical protein